MNKKQTAFFISMVIFFLAGFNKEYISIKSCKIIVDLFVSSNFSYEENSPYSCEYSIYPKDCYNTEIIEIVSSPVNSVISNLGYKPILTNLSEEQVYFGRKCKIQLHADCVGAYNHCRLVTKCNNPKEMNIIKFITPILIKSTEDFTNFLEISNVDVEVA